MPARDRGRGARREREGYLRAMTPVDRLALSYLRAVGAESRWVHSSLGRLHNLELTGKGTLGTVVLIHGLSARATHFAAMVQRLRHHFSRIVIPDLLGHGLSAILPRPMKGHEVQQALDEALDVLVEEPAVVYGNSLGGYGAIRFAGRVPERVRILVVNSPGGAVLSGVSLQAYLDRFRIQDSGDAHALLERYLSKRIPMKRLLAHRVSQQLNNPSIRSFIDEISEDDYLTPRHLAQLSMPVLFLWGQSDQVMLPEQLDYFRRHLPAHVQLEEPKEYGHAPYIEHPFHLSDRLLRFTSEHLS